MSTQTHETKTTTPEPAGQTPPPPRIRLEKTIEQFAAEQGVKPMTRWEDYCGTARHLWDSDEDFESFLKAAHRPIEERA